MSDIKILIVDDHEVVRIGLASIIELSSDFKVIGQAGTRREAVDSAKFLKPNVILMDIRLPDGSGIDACKEIVDNIPDVKVIMLTSFADDELIISAIKAGAKGYVLKQIGSREIIDAIKTVMSGASLLDPLITYKVLESIKNGESEGNKEHAFLTLQELKIIALIAEGKTNKEIGNVLYLSDKTVKNYVSIILKKLNFHNRAEAAAYAVRENIKENIFY